MVTIGYEIRECENPACRFRFPAATNINARFFCPKCYQPARLVHFLKTEIESTGMPAYTTSGSQVEVLLDNIRSTLNVGSMFRTADGAGIQKIHLAGITPTPEHPKVQKTGLGAEGQIPWEQHNNAVLAVEQFKQAGFKIIALEDGAGSVPLFNINSHLFTNPIMLVVGNEITGVDPDILAECDTRVWIPMQGSKRSLNVAIAFGIAAYYFRFPPQFN
jgi:23S rRNA (guanosine2251-2'-O)-methyltransferase